MASADTDIATFKTVARANSALRWYAITDSAQHKSLPGAVTQAGVFVRCLFGATQGSPLADHSPHLVELCSPIENSRSWNWIGLHAKSKPCITIIAAEMAFDELFVQLAESIEVELPDGFEMFLAFWDPVILGTLMGQGDDRTLHVPGPVLTAGQRAKLTGGMQAWWYWDRHGTMHSLDLDATQNRPPNGPLTLTQAQVDDLVEACVPDHVLYYVQLNQPQLVAEIPVQLRYGVVREALVLAREIGLLVMRDLVNFVCVKLIYGERLETDKTILTLLERVQHGRLTLAQALDEFP